MMMGEDIGDRLKKVKDSLPLISPNSTKTRFYHNIGCDDENRRFEEDLCETEKKSISLGLLLGAGVAATSFYFDIVVDYNSLPGIWNYALNVTAGVSGSGSGFLLGQFFMRIPSGNKARNLNTFVSTAEKAEKYIDQS